MGAESNNEEMDLHNELISSWRARPLGLSGIKGSIFDEEKVVKENKLKYASEKNVTVSYEGGEFILNHSKSLGQRVVFRISNYLETIHRVFIYYK